MTTKSEFIAKRKAGPTSQEIKKQATPWQARDKRGYNPENAIGPSPRTGATLSESSVPIFV